MNGLQRDLRCSPAYCVKRFIRSDESIIAVNGYKMAEPQVLVAGFVQWKIYVEPEHCIAHLPC